MPTRTRRPPWSAVWLRGAKAQFTIHERMATGPLIQQLQDAWHRHPLLDGKLHVVNASTGRWDASGTQPCTTPRLLLLLSGHYRTFSWTAPLLGETMQRSSDDCFFAVAALPADIDGVPGSAQFMPWVTPEYRGAEPVRSSYTTLWQKLNPGPESRFGRLAWYVRQVSDRFFRSRLAFAVMRRSGDLDRWPGGCKRLYTRATPSLSL